MLPSGGWDVQVKNCPIFPNKVSEVLRGGRGLSLNMIRRLSTGLGIPAEILIREPAQKAADSAEIDWEAFPLREMRKRGYFEGYAGSLQELKEYAAEWVTRFLSSSPGGCVRGWYCREALR